MSKLDVVAVVAVLVLLGIGIAGFIGGKLGTVVPFLGGVPK